MQKDNARDIIAELVARFAEQIDSYKHSDYNETQTRRDFIRPLLQTVNAQNMDKLYKNLYRLE